MPFYCGKRSTGICVILSQKNSSTYSSEYAASFFEPRPRICERFLCLAMKNYSDRFLDPTQINNGSSTVSLVLQRCTPHAPGGLLPFATAFFSPRHWNASWSYLSPSRASLRPCQITAISDSLGLYFLARPSLFKVGEPCLSKEESPWTIKRQNVRDRLLHLHS